MERRGSQDQQATRYLQPVNPPINDYQLQKEIAPVKTVLKIIIATWGGGEGEEADNK